MKLLLRLKPEGFAKPQAAEPAAAEPVAAEAAEAKESPEDPAERARRWMKLLLRLKPASANDAPGGASAQGPLDTADLFCKPWELPDPPEVPVPVYSGTGVGLLYDRRMARHRDLEDSEHPEQPMRIVRIFQRLEEEGLVARCVRIPCRKAVREVLELKHTTAHVDAVLSIEGLSEAEAIQFGKGYNSVYMCPQTTQAALLSAGSVLEGVAHVCAGDVASAVCVVRPPGHHAENHCAMGFCMFGNIPIAVAEARRQGWVQRVLIVDWDIHHGNGTQHMFEDDGNVLFFSVHRHDNGRFYPGGTGGHFTSHGTGNGEGFSVNVPWDVKGAKKKGCLAPGDAEYLEVFAKVLLPVAADFSPDLVVVSAGFDSALGDPLGECRLTPAGYHELTRQLMDLAGGRLVLALEGGYNLSSISASMAACVRALLGDPPHNEGQLKETPACDPYHAEMIEQVRAHYAQWWPSLRHPGDEAGGSSKVRVPVSALKGTLLEMELALREHAEKTGHSLELLRQQHEALVFKLEDVPQPQLPPGQDLTAWENLRARLARAGADEPPYLLPVVHVASPEQALRNATLVYRAGAHGVWLVNSGHAHDPPDAALPDSPPTPQRTSLKGCTGPHGKAGKAQLGALAECFAAVRRELPDFWIGVSILQLPPAQAFKWIAAHCPSANAVWLEDLPCKPGDVSWEAPGGSEPTAEPATEAGGGGPEAAAPQQQHLAVRLERWLPDSQPALKGVKRERMLVRSWSGMVFGSVAGEKQEQVHHQQDSKEQGEACQVLLRHWASLASSLCDVVVASAPGGGASGAPSPMAKLRAMCGVAPLALLDGALDQATAEECVDAVDVVIADAAFGDRGKGDVTDFDQERLGQWVSRWRGAAVSVARAR